MHSDLLAPILPLSSQLPQSLSKPVALSWSAFAIPLVDICLGRVQFTAKWRCHWGLTTAVWRGKEDTKMTKTCADENYHLKEEHTHAARLSSFVLLSLFGLA